jgi:hypothetical protein
MQHVFGKPYHRTTWWRRLKAQDRPVRIGRRKNGRGFSEDNRTRSFVLFTAAVIQNVNVTGHCDYAAIWQQPRPSGFGFHYRDVPNELFQRLADSGFPPAMLAVAVCDTVPLNKITPRKPSSSSKLFLHQKAKVQMKKAGTVCDADHFPIAERRERLKAVLRESGESQGQVRQILAEAEKVAYKADWLHVYLREYKSPTEKKFSGAMPIAPSSRGTLAHDVDYTGAEMSRRMACYWRNHRGFRRCLKLIRSLIAQPIPKVPYEGGLTMIDWELDSAFKQHMQLMRAKRTTALSG